MRDEIDKSKLLELSIRSLEKQLLDAFQEGKLDTVTYNSMFITVNKIKSSITKSGSYKEIAFDELCRERQNGDKGCVNCPAYDLCY